MERYICCLDGEIVRLKKEEQELGSQNRKDESDLVKIRVNILDVCKTICRVVERTEKEESRKTVYLQKLGGLRASWQGSRERAAKYDDADKVLIEDVKLETLAWAERMFEELHG